MTDPFHFAIGRIPHPGRRVWVLLLEGSQDGRGVLVLPFLGQFLCHTLVALEIFHNERLEVGLQPLKMDHLSIGEGSVA